MEHMLILKKMVLLIKRKNKGDKKIEILTTVDKTMISDIKFIYLDNEEIILHERDKIFYEISDSHLSTI